MWNSSFPRPPPWPAPATPLPQRSGRGSIRRQFLGHALVGETRRSVLPIRSQRVLPITSNGGADGRRADGIPNEVARPVHCRQIESFFPYRGQFRERPVGGVGDVLRLGPRDRLAPFDEQDGLGYA